MRVSAWRGIFFDCLKKSFLKKKKPFLSGTLLAAKNGVGIECFVHATVKLLLYDTARQASTVQRRIEVNKDAIWQGTPYTLSESVSVSLGF